MSIVDAGQVAAEIIGAFVTVVAIMVVIVIYFRAKLKAGVTRNERDYSQNAIEALTATVEGLKTQNGMQAGQIGEMSKQITVLTGTVNTLKDVPLAKIEKHMEDTNKILAALIPLIPQQVEKTVTTTSTTSLK